MANKVGNGDCCDIRTGRLSTCDCALAHLRASDCQVTGKKITRLAAPAAQVLPSPGCCTSRHACVHMLVVLLHVHGALTAHENTPAALISPHSNQDAMTQVCHNPAGCC